MPETPNSRVMQATWNWQSDANVPDREDPRSLRRSALIQTLVMVLVAAILYLGPGHHLAARIIGALAGLVLVLGLALPRAYRPIHAFGRRLGRLAGRGLSYLLLVPFFYLFFTPAALLLRLQGRDPLDRRFRDSRWTYWIARSPKGRTDNIEKQFLREDPRARKRMRPVDDAGEPRP